MERAIYNGAAAQRAYQERLEAVASNLANLGTPAYKRQTAKTQVFRLPGAVPGAAQAHEPRTVRSIDFTQGPLRPTGAPLDLALEGPGFFVVEGVDGEELTRDGSFRLDPEGVLTTGDGRPVAWAGGRGTVDPVGEALVVDPAGVVRQGVQEVGRLRLVDYERTDALEPAPAGRFRAPQELRPVEATGLVRQGALESSNSRAVDELVALITAQRGHETATNVMQMVARSYERLLNQR